MQKPRRALLVFAAVLLVAAGMLEFAGSFYHYTPISFRYGPDTPQPKPQLLTFGPNRDPWVIEIKYWGDRKHDIGTLTIYRDERTSMGLPAKYYLWNPSDRDRIPPAKGWWVNHSGDTDFIRQQFPNLKSLEREGKIPPAQQIMVGVSEMSALAAYMQLVNLDDDSDQEIFIFNESQPYRVMHWNDVWLGRGTYYVDYMNGQFKLKRYWLPGGFLAQTARRHILEMFLFACSLIVFLLCLFPRGFPYHYSPFIFFIFLIPGLWAVRDGFFVFIGILALFMFLAMLAALIALIYFHWKYLRKPHTDNTDQTD